ncbi:hypothetical protein [Xenorhabdus sp. KJ12.1]|uniref:hypothetical protein n=1 Tax=Xenorhabdus sp. KJ12.1 TaxID=1851571 RepID=UPI000C064AB4|nr:hypothetical protein [Xenorhabdus sp. KJ12.1]PHM72211.1 hypothetical protein Xekj_00489 [Xenorhabdus sp. KJ12.1]
MKTTNEFYFNEAVGGTQHGFTSSQLSDLIGFVHDNRNPDFYMFRHEVPIFDSTVTINIYHPDAPDTLCLYLYEDKDGLWWPYATLDCLADVKYLLKSIWIN